MTRPNPSLWPAGSCLHFYNGRGRLLGDSKDRKLDLADTLMLHWSKASRTVYLGIRCQTVEAGYWDEGKVHRIEERIRFDLGFDAYNVSIERLRPLGELPLASEFFWKLRVRPK